MHAWLLNNARLHALPTSNKCITRLQCAVFKTIGQHLGQVKGASRKREKYNRWTLFDAFFFCPAYSFCTYARKHFVFPVADMSSRVEAREDTEDLQVWLDGDHMLDDAQDGGEGTAAAAIDPCWRSNMLIQILLKAGQASPTHTFVYLDRCVAAM